MYHFEATFIILFKLLVVDFVNFKMHPSYKSSYIWTKSKPYLRKSHDHFSKKDKYKNHDGTKTKKH